MKTHLSVLAAVGVSIVLLLPGCKPGTAGAKKETEADKPVRVETLGRTDMAEVLNYAADLLPYAEVTIFSPVYERILYFPWEDGDEIRNRKGQRVALIRKAGLDKGLEQIVAQMEALDIQIKNLESDVERSKELLKKGAITKAMFDKVQTSYLATIAQRKALEAGRGRLAVQAGNAVINAPISGVIAGKMVERGDMAAPQIPLCRIISIDRLKVQLKLVEADVPKVHTGQEVEIHMDCCPGRPFTGKISRIYPYLNAQTRTNTVEVTLENPKDKKRGVRELKPGMFGKAELVVGRRDQVLAAPEPALLLDNTLLKEQKEGEILRKAFVVDDQNLAKQRLVKLGARNGSYYEVLEGLAEGENIIIRGQHGLKDGQKVKILSLDK
jgi:RND family efflux transporter MFP subunit